MSRFHFSNDLEIAWVVDDKQMTIGEKRNKLYNYASGLYSLQIDDDDDLCDGWDELIWEALGSRPDCVTYKEKCIINGGYYSSNHSLKYADWGENQDGFDYVRTPFFKDVIRTEIAKSVPVPHIRFGEDHEWSRLIKPFLKTEEHIDKELYYYIHESSDPTERYGLNK